MFKTFFGGAKDEISEPVVPGAQRHTGMVARIGIRHSRCSDFADTCVILIRGQSEPLVAEVKDLQLANEITLSSAGDSIAIEIAKNEKGVPTVFAFENETLTAIKKECAER